MSNLVKSIERFREDPEHNRLFLESQAEVELSERMTEMRLDARLTQAELAQRLGKTQAYVAKMETGGYDRCGIGTLRTFARAMGSDLAVSQMFTRTDAPTRRAVEALSGTREARSSDEFSKVTILAEVLRVKRVAAAG